MTDRPWETEPTSLDFKADGLPCAMRRNDRGVWCGYVGVGREHPLFGLPRTHQLKLPQSWFAGRRLLEGSSALDIFSHMLREDDDTYAISLAFQVHGGVTFADHARSLSRDYWWFGFDCGHAGDYLPSYDLVQMIDSLPKEMADVIREVMNKTPAVYRDQEYVVSECQSLAAQLNAIVKVLNMENGNGRADHRSH